MGLDLFFFFLEPRVSRTKMFLLTLNIKKNLFLHNQVCQTVLGIGFNKDMELVLIVFFMQKLLNWGKE